MERILARRVRRLTPKEVGLTDGGDGGSNDGVAGPGVLERHADASRESHLSADRHHLPTVEEFLIKYKGLSYIHCEWVREEFILRQPNGKQRLQRFLLKEQQEVSRRGLATAGAADEDHDEEDEAIAEDWVTVDRILAEHRGPDGAVQYLVKWCSLGYDECTWEHDFDVQDDLKVQEFRERNRKPPDVAFRRPPRPPPSAYQQLPNPDFKNDGELPELHPGRRDGARQDHSDGVTAVSPVAERGRARAVPGRGTAVHTGPLEARVRDLDRHERDRISWQRAGARGDPAVRVDVSGLLAQVAFLQVADADHHLRDGATRGQPLAQHRLGSGSGRRGAPPQEPAVETGGRAVQPAVGSPAAADWHAAAKQRAGAVRAATFSGARALLQRAPLSGVIRRHPRRRVGGAPQSHAAAVSVAPPERGRGARHPAQRGDHHQRGADAHPEEVVSGDVRAELCVSGAQHPAQQRGQPAQYRDGVAQVLQSSVPHTWRGRDRDAERGRAGRGVADASPDSGVGQVGAGGQAVTDAEGQGPPRADLFADDPGVGLSGGLSAVSPVSVRAHRWAGAWQRAPTVHRPVPARLGQVCVSAVHARRRPRHQPHRGGHGDHFRQRLEPAERCAGAGALSSHRPGEGCQRVSVDHPWHVRGGDVRPRQQETRAGSGGAAEHGHRRP
eukprot:ctg_2802.g595